MTRAPFLFLVALAVPCIGCAPPVDLFTTDASPVDAPRDAPMEDAASPWTAGYHRLVATIPGSPSLIVGVDVFLPDGLEAGDRWLVRRVDWPDERDDGVLDASGRATASVFCSGCSVGFDAHTSCLLARFPADTSLRLTPESDQGVIAPAELSLCETAASAPTTVSFLPAAGIASLGALEVLMLGGAPLDVATLTDLTFVTPDGVVTSSFAGDAWGGTLTLARPIEPDEQVMLDVGPATTILGVPIEAAFSPLVTSSVVVDRTFTSAPPVGSIASTGYELVFDAGFMTLTDEGRSPRRRFSAVIALGEPAGAATTVTLTGRVSARPTSLTEAALYRDGARSESVTWASGSPVLTIPADVGPLFLLLYNPQQLPQPIDGANPEVFALDEIIID